MLSIIAFLLLTICFRGANSLPTLAFWRQCEMLDLSHDLVHGEHAHAVEAYKENPFKKENLIEGMAEGGFDPFYIYFNKLSMTEHEGTHMDAPKHVLANEEVAATAATVEQVPFTSIMGEACVVDVPKEHENNLDYLITPNDLKNWERKHGPFHEDCIVCIRSGREKHWQDTQNFLGVSEGEDPMHLNEHGWPDMMHWPALSAESAQWLLDNRGIKAIAQDAVSVDGGQQYDWAHSVHSVLLGSGRVAFENVANLSKLPHRGAHFIGLPLKIRGGSGSPCRILSYGWNGPTDPCRYEHPTQKRSDEL